MPKRIVDGEAISTSKTLRKVPEHYRIHYPYLITLAMANGVFECDAEAIWATRYALLMPSITPEIVATMLRAFEDAGLLFRYTVGDKTLGFWTRINQPGRLPPPSRVGDEKRHERIGIPPSEAELSKYMEAHANGDGYPMASHNVASGCLGLGLGKGMGKGKNPSTSQGAVADARHNTIREAVKAIQKGVVGEEIWDGSAAAALDRLLKKQPKFPVEKLLRGVVNRFASEGRSPSEHPRVWIGSIQEYIFSPQDRYNKTDRSRDTQFYWSFLGPTHSTASPPKQSPEAACASHAEFVRSLGDKAPPTEKVWLERYNQSHTKEPA